MKNTTDNTRIENYRNQIIEMANTALTKKCPPPRREKEEYKDYQKRIKKLPFWKSSKRSRFSYNDDFKYACMKLHESGVSITALSKLYNVSRTSLYRWKKSYSEMFVSLPLQPFRTITAPVEKYKAPAIEVMWVTEPEVKVAIAA